MTRKMLLHAAVFVACGATNVAYNQKAEAQIRASEAATVSQTVDGTTFTISYSRPRLRGRTQIFGRQIPWEEVWTPGANLATKLTATRDFFINGHPMKAGSYSVWMQVKEKGAWSFILHKDTTRQHFMHPKVESALLNFPVTPQTVPPVEVLTWSFPLVTADGATMQMEWSNMRVPIELRVTPSISRTVSAADGLPYEGVYDVEWLWDKDHPQHAPMTIRYNAADSTLRAESTVEPKNMILVKMSDGVFSPIFFVEDQIADSGETMLVEFKRESGKAVSFEVRDKQTDAVQARATIKH